jgi:hypothetical protein
MKLTLLILISVFITSCVQFNYVTIDGENIKKNDQKEFVVENEEVKVIYRFTGYRGAVHISVFNKTDQPIAVNWKKSALIMNGNAVSYFSPVVNITGQARTDSSFFISTRSEIQAQGLVNPEIEFIPPSAAISRQPLQLPIYSFPYDANDLKKQRVQTSDGSFITFRNQQFNKENSPMKFRSYLYLQQGSGKEILLDHNFYVTDLKQSFENPVSFSAQVAAGDFIYFVK